MPLAGYSPAQVIPGARVPGLEVTSDVLKPNRDALRRQSTSTSEASATSSSSSHSYGVSSERTLIDNGVAGDEADLAREIEKYKITLVFANLPFAIYSTIPQESVPQKD